MYQTVPGRIFIPLEKVFIIPAFSCYTALQKNTTVDYTLIFSSPYLFNFIYRNLIQT